MGTLSTHVLDTAHGTPAGGVTIRLVRIDPVPERELLRVITNADGRTDEPLLTDDHLQAATYELHFDVGAYFAERAGRNSAGNGAADGVPAGNAFLSVVTVRFTVTDAAANYHVPLLVSPWSYTTYRGS